MVRAERRDIGDVLLQKLALFCAPLTKLWTSTVRERTPMDLLRRAHIEPPGGAGGDEGVMLETRQLLMRYSRNQSNKLTIKKSEEAAFRHFAFRYLSCGYGAFQSGGNCSQAIKSSPHLQVI